MDEAINKILLESMRLKRRSLIVGAAADSFLSLIVILFIFFNLEVFSTAMVIGLLIISLPMPIFFIYRLSLYRNLQQNPFMNIIKQDPGKFVWAYDYRADVAAEGARIPELRSILVVTDDKKRFTLPVRKENKEKLMSFLREVSPNIVVGYSKENRIAFRKDPSNMSQYLKS